MKTIIFILSLFVGFTTLIFAQQTQVYENQLSGSKTSFKRNNAGDNWFVNISGGIQAYNIDESYKGVSLLDRVAFIPALSIGKWVNPYCGIRLKGQGLNINSYAEGENGNFIRHRNDYLNLHVDAMCDLTNHFGVYSPTKLFNFAPYIGLGWAHRFKPDGNTVSPVSNPAATDHSSDAFSINGGIQFGFRLSNRVNLDFDLGITYLGDYFDRIDQKGENDNIFAAMGGITYKLGKSDFDAIEPMNYILLDNLNLKINDLRHENDSLSKRSNPPCPKCPPVAPTMVKNEIINYVPNVVFFRMNSSKVDDNQQVNVYNTASFINESGEKIKVIGYADKDTGTTRYNLELSEKRAKAVAKELITKYNVPSEKITVEWKGSEEQPYPQNNWNRVVIMSSFK